MKKKDYLLEELTKDEKAYIKAIVGNRRKRYINNRNVNIYEFINVEDEFIVLMRFSFMTLEHLTRCSGVFFITIKCRSSPVFKF